MSTHATSRTGATEFGTDGAHRGAVRRLSTETKASFKTTEFFAYLAVLAGILVAGIFLQEYDGEGFYIRSGIIVVPKGGVIRDGVSV